MPPILTHDSGKSRFSRRMLWFIAIICPPLAILLCGKVPQAIISAYFCAALLFVVVTGWSGYAILFLPVIHALFVVNKRLSGK